MRNVRGTLRGLALLTAVGVEVVEGLDEKYVDEGLRVAYDAFAEKFRIGFRNADDFTRFFRDSADTTSCLSAVIDGRFAGILTIQTADYHLNPAAAFTRFSPLRATRILFNVVLLANVRI